MRKRILLPPLFLSPGIYCNKATFITRGKGVGTKKEIQDRAAIAFSKGFYGALGEGESIERAFELGCNQIALEIYENDQDQPSHRLVPIYSTEEQGIINVPQHQVLSILVKEPLNPIYYQTRKTISIETYLREEIEPLPRERVFNEEFSFEDIYVPLKAISLESGGNRISNTDEFVLEEWARTTILDPERQDKVIFIQAAPGRGKTVFCRMFADWVRQNLHPRLTPIFIPLRNIRNFESSLANILSEALSPHDFVASARYPAWLTDRNTRYLFLLDGFDELPREGRGNDVIQDFIEKVGYFQQRFQGEETGHRIILTGRPLALQGINYLPDNFERVKLLEMNDDLRDKWLEKWQQVIIPDNPDAAIEETEKFKGFLEADTFPEEIKDELAREPLLLYLLAKLHQEGEIKQEDFQQASNSSQAKILIYQRSLDWVLNRQRNESLLRRIAGLEISSLKNILLEAGLSVVQSGGEYTTINMIETRLTGNSSETRGIINRLQDTDLTTALGVFYLRPTARETREMEVEFYHKSFSEFLFAKRLQRSFSTWTTTVEINRQQQWSISQNQLAEQIYDLLGYGGLTPEIVEYLRGLWLQSNEFDAVKLFQRLSDFFERWCDGEFIDSSGTTLPQIKMRELREQLPERETYLGQRQVDIYVGLNIMILLLELHRYGQSQTEDIKQQLTFYPCGQPQDNNALEDSTQLLRLIGYSTCIGARGFRDTVSNFLEGANLESANLSESDLSGAKLKSAKLEGADLSHTNFGNANFIRANLARANLYGANLYDANLYDADLGDANLARANLARTNLTEGNLYSANLESTSLIDAYLVATYLESVNLARANLTGCNLESAYLTNANLTGANLTNANLIESNNLISSQIKMGCYWDQAIYRGHWDNE